MTITITTTTVVIILNKQKSGNVIEFVLFLLLLPISIAPDTHWITLKRLTAANKIVSKKTFSLSHIYKQLFNLTLFIIVVAAAVFIGV